MSELGETFKAFKEARDEKKVNNVKSSIKVLEDNNIFFICCNECTRHYLVLSEIDFWPSTGVWMKRKTNKRGRGVFNLMKFINANYPNPRKLVEKDSEQA